MALKNDLRFAVDNKHIFPQIHANIFLDEHIKDMVKEHNVAKELFIAMMLKTIGFIKVKRKDMRKFVLVERDSITSKGPSKEYTFEYRP